MFKVKLIGTFLTYDKDKSLKNFLKYKKSHHIFYKEEKIKWKKINLIFHILFIEMEFNEKTSLSYFYSLVLLLYYIEN